MRSVVAGFRGRLNDVGTVNLCALWSWSKINAGTGRVKHGGEQVKVRKRDAGRVVLAAGSVMEVWPAHDYSAFMPSGSLQQRVAGHWVNVGERLREGINRAQSDQGMEKNDERKANGGPA